MTIKKVIFNVVLVSCALIALVFIKLSIERIEPTTKVPVTKLQYNTTKDSVETSASIVYEADIMQRVLQGNNYRESWATKIKAPILILDTLYGGVSIVKEGGGMQTKSLRLKAKNGLLLTLRSVAKNPEPLVPDYLKSLNLENIVLDGISGQHPYASIVVSELATSLNLLHTHPKLVFLPNQTQLRGEFSEYTNSLFWLEFENKSAHNWTDYENIVRIVDTEDLQELKQHFRDSLSINKQQLIRARLFDVVIGDWDRHAKQWGWVIQKLDNQYNAIPLPTDRDNAFFDIEGIVNTIITNQTITPRLQNFENEIDYIEGQVYDFDVYFLQHTTKEDFIEQARYIQNNLTNSIIEKAFSVWNEKLYALNAEELIEKIKFRRDNLVNTAQMFYKVLQNRPLLNQPLKGSDSTDTDGTLIQCFEC